MLSLKSDLVKRIERLPKPVKTSDALQPLFEAISNSIHSTQARFGAEVAEKGKVSVTVVTGRKQAPVTAVVQDNGIGLSDKNFDAFVTTDTDNKIAIGGKGVGRLLWLDCFEDIKVRSVYFDGKQSRFREFDFKLALDNQIQNLREGILKKAEDTGMTVSFNGIQDNAYRTRFPGRATYILHHIMSHFLPTFIGKSSPQVFVTCGDETRVYPGDIDELIYRREDVEEFETPDFGKLSIALMECDKIASANLEGSHFVHFIAHDRTVRSQKIDGRLGLKHFGANGNHVFHACLFGKYLDDHVNQERTGFTFGDDTIEEIVNSVCMPEIERFLAQPLREQREAQRATVESIVTIYPSVAFGSPDELQEYVPLGETAGDAIYAHLSRQRFRRDEKQTEKIADVMRKLKEGAIDSESLAAALREATNAIESAEQRSLAEYVVRRKVVLDFLEVLVEKVRDETQDSAYQTEDVLHSFICPMKVDAASGDGRKIGPASHDLWIIDERLTFAQFFSSDVPISDFKEGSADDDRPDLLIFDRIFGMRQTEESSKILLVEFKRPGRKTYKDDENPQFQVERYVAKLMSGGVLDFRGRPVRLTNAPVFYCFVVADCLGKMRDWTYSWGPTPDGRGKLYMPGTGSAFRGSIELIEWDSLIHDARDRNKAFFDRAGINAGNVFGT